MKMTFFKIITSLHKWTELLRILEVLILNSVAQLETDELSEWQDKASHAKVSHSRQWGEIIPDYSLCDHAILHSGVPA